MTNELRNNICSILETGSNYFDYLQSYRVPGVPVGRMPVDFAYRNLCNREPPALPAPEFTGGQCPVQYRVFYLVRYDTRANPPPDIQEVEYNLGCWGPVRGIEIERQTLDDFVVIRASVQNNPTQVERRFGFSIRRFNGQGILGVRILRVQRIDLGPDNCGSLPPPEPTPPDPNYRRRPFNITYNDNSNNSVNLNGTLIIARPTVNFNGELNIPVRILIPGITIPITGNFNVNRPEFNFNFNNPNYAPSPEPGPDDYNSPDNTPPIPPGVPPSIQPPSPIESSPQSFRVLRGCIVTVTKASPTNSIINQNDNPDIYAPNLGYVNFLIAIGQRTAWTEDIPVKNLRQFVSCPWEGGAIDVKGTPRVGVIWSISPVYARQEDVIQFT